jgi:hypothetical protein
MHWWRLSDVAKRMLVVAVWLLLRFDIEFASSGGVGFANGGGTFDVWRGVDRFRLPGRADVVDIRAWIGRRAGRDGGRASLIG